MTCRENAIFSLLSPPQSFMDAPIISLAESKDEDMEWGIAQCAAQLYGAKLFNEAENKNIPILYGCATDGVEWQFMRFENNIFYLDNKVYTDLKEILGVWHFIVRLYLKYNFIIRAYLNFTMWELVNKFGIQEPSLINRFDKWTI
jgi:hypothetical protein